MEIEWIEAFAAVADTGSFSEAAEQLFLAQPVVSKRVQKLEGQLGVRLLDRSRRQTRLTAAGQRVRPHAQALLQQYQLFRQAAGQGGELRLALFPVADHYGFLRLLAGFSAARPELQLAVEERESAAIPALLAGGRLDGAFYRTLDRTLPKGAVLLWEEDMALLMPKALAPQGPGPVPLARLCSERFLLLSSGTGLLEASVSLCRKAGFLPKVGYTGASAANIARMVREGAGVALLARQVAESAADEGLLALDCEPTFGSRLIFHPSAAGLQNPAMPALLAFLRAAAEAAPHHNDEI